MSLDHPNTFLLAVGIGTVVGVLFGSWILSAAHKLLVLLTKLALLGAVVVIAILVWNSFQQAPERQDLTSHPGYPPTSSNSKSGYSNPPPKQPSDRWWEE